RSVGGGRRHAEWRDRVDGLDAPGAAEEPGTTVDAENAVADPDHRVDASEHALAEPGGVEPAIEEGQPRAQAPATTAHVLVEIGDRALAPELPDSAVGWTAVVLVQAHRRRIDEARVPNGHEHRAPGQPVCNDARHEHVLVLDVDDVDVLGTHQARELQARGEIRDRVQEKFLRPERAARRPGSAARQPEPPDPKALALLDG